MSTKPPERERLKKRWFDAQDLSGGLHAAAISGNIEVAQGSIGQSKAARTGQ